MKIYLDLLPKKRKKEIRRRKRFLVILREEMFFSLPVFVFVAILLNVWYLISVQRDVLLGAHSATQSQEKYQQLSTYEEKFKQVNETSSLLLKIEAGHLHWKQIFEKMSQVTPAGISIADFSTKNYRVFLLGKAKDREALLDFKSKLEAEECYESVNVPLSNLVVKTDVDFQIDFSIKKDCLKK